MHRCRRAPKREALTESEALRWLRREVLAGRVSEAAARIIFGVL